MIQKMKRHCGEKPHIAGKKEQRTLATEGRFLGGCRFIWQRCRNRASFSLVGFFVFTMLIMGEVAPAIGQANRAAGPPSTAVTSRVSEVTLYRTQALVTRTVTLSNGIGEHEYVVGNLPAQIISDSLFAETENGLEVRGVRYRTRAVRKEPSAELQGLDGEIEKVRSSLQAISGKLNLLNKRKQYLDKMENFVAVTSTQELKSGVLNAATLHELAEFNFSQRDKIDDEEFEYNAQRKKLTEELDYLQKKRNELSVDATKVVREAVLFVQKKEANPVTLHLSYLVNNCGWSPSYTLRGDTQKKSVNLEYSALIHQMTGENWSQIDLTLSTASPAMSAHGPGLAPFKVTLGTGATGQRGEQVPVPQGANVVAGDPFSSNGRPPIDLIQGRGRAANQQRLDYGKNLRAQQQALEFSNRANHDKKIQADTNWKMNIAANGMQQLEFYTQANETLQLAQTLAEITETPSIDYSIQGTVSLASRADQQVVRVLKADLDGTFYHVATPVLTSYVYREAELKNLTGQDLLGGVVTVYLDNQFVGRGDIPTVTRQELFVVGFGADSQVRARRVLANKTEKVQGGNREQKFDYELSVENYKSNPITLRLLDRIPVSENENDIRVTLLGDSDKELSKDKAYLRTDRKEGILRWDITVKPQATADEAHRVDYSYNVVYDRKLQLISPQNSKEEEREFQELQRRRKIRK